MFLKFRDISFEIGNLDIQILELLKNKSMYGYEIIQTLKEFKLNTASLYPALRRLEKKGLIKSFYSDQKRGYKRRKNYELTEEGFKFVERFYDINEIPDYYIKLLNDVIDTVKQNLMGKKTLVIDSTNFISTKTLLSKNYLFGSRIPSNIEFIRYFDLISQENDNKYDFIFTAFPFFIRYDINDTVKKDLESFFVTIKSHLTEEGSLLVLDLYWERNAILDIFSYLITKKIIKIAFTFEEMRDILYKASFKNFRVFRMEQGVIFFTCPADMQFFK